MHFSLLVIRKKDTTTSVESDMMRYYEGEEVDAYITMTKDEVIETTKNMIRKFEDNPEIMVFSKKEYLGVDEWIEEVEKTSEIHRDEDEKGYLKTMETAFLDAKEKYRIYKESIGWTDKDYINYYKEISYENMDEEGNVISTYNPESQWDWYEVGGRWSGMLKLKGSAVKRYNGKTEVDEALVKDIDWRKMYAISKEDLRHRKNIWNLYVLPGGYKSSLEGEDKKREFKELFGVTEIWTSPKYMLDKYKTIEDFLRAESLFSTYAVLDNDGEWHDKEYAYDEDGDKFDFEKTARNEFEWELNFYDRFIKDLDPMDKIIIIDYHI